MDTHQVYDWFLQNFLQTYSEDDLKGKDYENTFGAKCKVISPKEHILLA